MSDKITPSSLNIPNQLTFLAPICFNELIRVGNETDGGYVIPSPIIRETEFLLSFGISEDWSFDAQFLALNPNLSIHAYDPTISKNYFKKRLVLTLIKLICGKAKVEDVLNSLHIHWEYRKFFRGKVKHYQERVNKHKNDSYDVMLQTIFGRIKSDKVFIKMDIEGGEYRVMDDLLKYFPQIIGMVIEFHDTGPLRTIFTDSVHKIKDFYQIVHIHANNSASVSSDEVPELLEITFLRKEFCNRTDKRSKLPLEGLDSTNEPRKPDYILNFNL